MCTILAILFYLSTEVTTAIKEIQWRQRLVLVEDVSRDGVDELDVLDGGRHLGGHLVEQDGRDLPRQVDRHRLFGTDHGDAEVVENVPLAQLHATRIHIIIL